MTTRIVRIIDNANKIVLEEFLHSLDYGKEWKSLRVEEKKKVKCEITKLQNRKSPGLLMSVTGVKKVEHCRTLGDLGT